MEMIVKIVEINLFYNACMRVIKAATVFRSLLKAGQQALTLGLLRGLDERPVEAPLTERDLTDQRLNDYKKRKESIN